MSTELQHLNSGNPTSLHRAGPSNSIPTAAADLVDVQHELHASSQQLGVAELLIQESHTSTTTIRGRFKKTRLATTHQPPQQSNNSTHGEGPRHHSRQKTATEKVQMDLVQNKGLPTSQPPLSPSLNPKTASSISRANPLADHDAPAYMALPPPPPSVSFASSSYGTTTLSPQTLSTTNDTVDTTPTRTPPKFYISSSMDTSSCLSPDTALAHKSNSGHHHPTRLSFGGVEGRDPSPRIALVRPRSPRSLYSTENPKGAAAPAMKEAAAVQTRRGLARSNATKRRSEGQKMEERVGETASSTTSRSQSTHSTSVTKSHSSHGRITPPSEGFDSSFSALMEQQRHNNAAIPQGEPEWSESEEHDGLHDQKSEKVLRSKPQRVEVRGEDREAALPTSNAVITGSSSSLQLNSKTTATSTSASYSYPHPQGGGQARHSQHLTGPSNSYTTSSNVSDPPTRFTYSHNESSSFSSASGSPVPLVPTHSEVPPYAIATAAAPAIVSDDSTLSMQMEESLYTPSSSTASHVDTTHENKRSSTRSPRRRRHQPLSPTSSAPQEKPAISKSLHRGLSDRAPDQHPAHASAAWDHTAPNKSSATPNSLYIVLQQKEQLIQDLTQELLESHAEAERYQVAILQLQHQQREALDEMDKCSKASPATPFGDGHSLLPSSPNEAKHHNDPLKGKGRTQRTTTSPRRPPTTAQETTNATDPNLVYLLRTEMESHVERIASQERQIQRLRQRLEAAQSEAQHREGVIEILQQEMNNELLKWESVVRELRTAENTVALQAIEIQQLRREKKEQERLFLEEKTQWSAREGRHVQEWNALQQEVTQLSEDVEEVHVARQKRANAEQTLQQQLLHAQEKCVQLDQQLRAVQELRQREAELLEEARMVEKAEKIALYEQVQKEQATSATLRIREKERQAARLGLERELEAACSALQTSTETIHSLQHALTQKNQEIQQLKDAAVERFEALLKEEEAQHQSVLSQVEFYVQNSEEMNKIVAAAEAKRRKAEAKVLRLTQLNEMLQLHAREKAAKAAEDIFEQHAWAAEVLKRFHAQVQELTRELEKEAATNVALRSTMEVLREVEEVQRRQREDVQEDVLREKQRSREALAAQLEAFQSQKKVEKKLAAHQSRAREVAHQLCLLQSAMWSVVKPFTPSQSVSSSAARGVAVASGSKTSRHRTSLAQHRMLLKVRQPALASLSRAVKPQRAGVKSSLGRGAALSTTSRAPRSSTLHRREWQRASDGDPSQQLFRSHRSSSSRSSHTETMSENWTGETSLHSNEEGAQRLFDSSAAEQDLTPNRVPALRYGEKNDASTNEHKLESRSHARKAHSPHRPPHGLHGHSRTDQPSTSSNAFRSTSAPHSLADGESDRQQKTSTAPFFQSSLAQLLGDQLNPASTHFSSCAGGVRFAPLLSRLHLMVKQLGQECGRLRQRHEDTQHRVRHAQERCKRWQRKANELSRHLEEERVAHQERVHEQCSAPPRQQQQPQRDHQRQLETERMWMEVLDGVPRQILRILEYVQLLQTHAQQGSRSSRREGTDGSIDPPSSSSNITGAMFRTGKTLLGPGMANAAGYPLDERGGGEGKSSPEHHPAAGSQAIPGHSIPTTSSTTCPGRAPPSAVPATPSPLSATAVIGPEWNTSAAVQLECDEVVRSLLGLEGGWSDLVSAVAQSGIDVARPSPVPPLCGDTGVVWDVSRNAPVNPLVESTHTHPRCASPQFPPQLPGNALASSDSRAAAPSSVSHPRSFGLASCGTARDGAVSSLASPAHISSGPSRTEWMDRVCGHLRRFEWTAAQRTALRAAIQTSHRLRWRSRNLHDRLAREGRQHSTADAAGRPIDPRHRSTSPFPSLPAFLRTDCEGKKHPMMQTSATNSTSSLRPHQDSVMGSSVFGNSSRRRTHDDDDEDDEPICSTEVSSSAFDEEDEAVESGAESATSHVDTPERERRESKQKSPFHQHGAGTPPGRGSMTRQGGYTPSRQSRFGHAQQQKERQERYVSQLWEASVRHVLRWAWNPHQKPMQKGRSRQKG